MNINTLERLSYIANVCRSQNTDPELSSMLGELDSTLQEELDEANTNIEIQYQIING